MSKRGERRPKYSCRQCPALVRRLGKHLNQKHPRVQADRRRREDRVVMPLPVQDGAVVAAA